MLDRVSSTIAPLRFLAFGATFVIAFAVCSTRFADIRIALLLGFNTAALVFLGLVLPLLNDNPGSMRRTAQANDANRAVLLAITALLSLVILVSIGTLIAGKASLHWQGISLVVGALALSWIFANTVFALHYAHLYYLQDSGGDRGGLQVPDTPAPTYWDFLYFSFTLGMTFQTSDIAVTGAHMRKVVLGHSVMAFLFNMGVLAFTVNALGGL